MKLVALASLVVIGCGSFAAQAQVNFPIERKADQISRDLSYEGRYLSSAQRADINSHLDAIRSIISGQTGTQSNYTCVSKDNDGYAPFVIATREGVVTKKVGIVFRSIDECKNTITQIRSFGPRGYLCVSKDNDGYGPFVITSIASGTFTPVQGTVFRAINDCNQTLQSMRPKQGQAVFCASKDADGYAPFIGMSIDLASGQVQRGTDQFRSIDECRAFFK